MAGCLPGTRVRVINNGRYPYDIRDVLAPAVKEETRKTAEAWVENTLYSGAKKKDVPTVGYLPRDYHTKKQIRVIGPIVTIY